MKCIAETRTLIIMVVAGRGSCACGGLLLWASELTTVCVCVCVCVCVYPRVRGLVVPGKHDVCVQQQGDWLFSRNPSHSSDPEHVTHVL
jgi:hypothetical protein